MPPTLYLIDGHALAYRMYFALTAGGSSTRWQTSRGEPTAGSYGFARELMRLIEQEKPDYLAVAFDTGKTFRDQIFPEYKGTRAKMPDDLSPQITRIRQIVDAFNIPRLEMGILAMQKLHRLINGEPEVAVKSVVYGELVVRESCGALPEMRSVRGAASLVGLTQV